MRRMTAFPLGAVAGMLLLLPASSARSECHNSSLLGSPIRFQTGPNAHYVATGDFNGDGIIDLAVTNGDLSAGSPNSSLAILIGTGNRGYAAPVLYSVGRSARGVVARDFNGDGIIDIAVANRLTNDVSILIGHGDGTFAPAVNYPAGPGAFEIVAADIDRDGILDLAIALNSSAGVCILHGLGSGGVGNGTFGPPVTLPLATAATGIATGDLNRDGVADLVVTQYQAGQVAVLLGTGSPTFGSGSFSAPAYYASGPQPFHVCVADFNGDGRPDLAVANTNFGGIAIMPGIGNGTFPSYTTVPTGNNSTVAVADVNQDGILDLVTGTITGSGSGVVELCLGQGSGGIGDGTFASPTSYSPGPGGDVYQVIAGDYDQDGNVDVLVAEGYGNQVDLLPGACNTVDPRAPNLTDVRDVPNDNGGAVFLTWTASSLDCTGGPVTNYRVWRRIPPAAALALMRSTLAHDRIMALPWRGNSSEIVYWEALATLPAQRLQGYGYTAATTQDSIRGSNPYTAFFVTALTSDIDVFYSSNVDSGYSVDNLPPRRPGGLSGQMSPRGVVLQWTPNDESDLSGYRVYRGSTDGFVPSEGTLIGAPQDPGWTDADGNGASYYKVSAIDSHANESDYAALAPTGITAVNGGPATLTLFGSKPNPSLDGRLHLDFSIQAGEPARLEIVDALGRRVATRGLTGWPAGRHLVSLGDKPFAPGVYMVRLVQGGHARECKVIVAR